MMTILELTRSSLRTKKSTMTGKPLLCPMVTPPFSIMVDKTNGNTAAMELL